MLEFGSGTRVARELLGGDVSMLLVTPYGFVNSTVVLRGVNRVFFDAIKGMVVRSRSRSVILRLVYFRVATRHVNRYPRLLTRLLLVLLGTVYIRFRLSRLIAMFIGVTTSGLRGSASR